ncbi:hypothetical protein IV102_16380 [bacterium]|nr:hypothetical protein [bacterium]
MILPPKDTERVVRLLCKLDVFADRKLALNTGITLTDVATELRNQVRVQWYNHPEVLDEYIETNPDRHSEEDLDLLRSWKGRQRQRYMVVKCLKSGAILADKEHYQVLGWNDSIEDLLCGASLPTMVETTLLPCGDKIAYDGILIRFNVFFGSGSRKNMNEEYSYARRHGQIRTSFGEAPKPLKPAGPAMCEHRPGRPGHLEIDRKIARRRHPTFAFPGSGHAALGSPTGGQQFGREARPAGDSQTVGPDSQGL